MSAKVLRLVHAQSRAPSRRWTNQDLAELYRITETLRRAGVDVDTDQGQTDEGDPWYCFCNRRTGDVLLHIAQVDDGYIAEIALLDRTLEARSFGDIVSQFLHAYPVVLPPSSRDAAARVWMHPASGLAALVMTLYMLNDMVRPAAMADGDRLVIDGEAIEVLDVQDEALARDTSTLHPREQQKSARPDTSSLSADSYRVATLAAALAIAAVVIDDGRTDLVSLLDHIGFSDVLSQAPADLSSEEAAILALAEMRAAAAQQQAADDAAAKGDGAAVQTAYSADDADLETDVTDGLVEFGLDGLDSAMLIDLATPDDRKVHEIGHEFGAALAAFLAAFSPEGEKAGPRDGSGKQLQTGYTAEASEAQADQAADGQDDGSSGPLFGLLADAAAGSLLATDAAGPTDGGESPGGSRPGSNDFLDALGLDSAPIVLASQSEISLLLSGLQTERVAFAPSGPSEPPGSPTSADTPLATPTVRDIAPTIISDTSGDVSGLGASDIPSSGTEPPDTSGSGQQPAIRPTASDSGDRVIAPAHKVDVAATIAQTQSPGTTSAEPADLPFQSLALDLSSFDAIAVVRAFVNVVGDVGVLYYRDTFYIYDKSPDPADTNGFEVETVTLADGDSVTLIGQPAAFQAVAETLA